LSVKRFIPLILALALLPFAFAAETVQDSGIIMGIEVEYDFKS